MLSKQMFVNQMNNELLMLHPEYHPSALISELTKIEASEGEMSVYTKDSMFGDSKPYRMHDRGIAVIPIHGYLAHRVDSHRPNTYTGYNYITNLVNAAVDDPEVRSIVLDVNSPGGMVNGAFETADVIRAAREKKPITAIVDSSAYSAAYLLSSAATSIHAPKSGGVGSIGVVTMHVDVSQMLEDEGIKVTMLYAGKYKVDGNPYEKLSEGARSRIETRLSQSYNLFVNTVAENRGIDPDVIIGTEAGIFQGEDAKTHHLIDAVNSPNVAFAVVAGELDKLGGIHMSEVESIEATTPEVATMDVESLKNEARSSEQSRIKGILTCEEAEGRQELANHIAFDTDMSVEAAQKLLGVSAKKSETGTQSASAFEIAMNNSDNPNVGSDDSLSSEEMDVVASITSDWKRATGRVN
jgi:signal peptide peptidase SppA